MKKIIEKVQKNKLLFSIFILFAFCLFIFITSGFNGAIVKDWYGIIAFIDNITHTTENGSGILAEMVWAICLIPVLLLFKNKYVFSEKKIPFKERIEIIWPMLLVTCAILILALGTSSAFEYFNVEEFFAILILCTFVGFFEELLCRGWLQNEFIERFGKDRKGVLFSITLSGLIFGTMHFMNYFAGRDLISTILQVVSAVTFGIYIGSIYFKTKNIWTCVFLHGLWDFAVLMMTLNKSISCGTMSEPTAVIPQLIAIVIMDLPGILTALKLLERVSLEKTINPKKRFTEEEIAGSERFNKVVSSIQLVIVSILSTTFIFIGVFLVGSPETKDACMLYETEIVSNVSFTDIDYTNYDLLINDYSYNIEAFEDKIVITDKEYGGKIEVYIPNIHSFAVIELDGKYIIEVLARPNEDGMVFYSDYINTSVVGSENFLENLKSSFTSLELPSVRDIGYYTTVNNEKYLWYRTIYETYYIKKGKTFKQLIAE